MALNHEPFRHFLVSKEMLYISTYPFKLGRLITKISGGVDSENSF